MKDEKELDAPGPEDESRVPASDTPEAAGGEEAASTPAATAAGEPSPPEAETPATTAGEGAAPGETETATEEKKKEKVAYELEEATERAGSIVDLKFKVPYAEYERKTGEFYKELRQNVIIDGFRRGKAPLKLIRNRYQKEVKQDTLDFLLENCLQQITEEKKYGVLRQFDRVDPEVGEGEDLTFSISLEIQPQVDPTGYEDLEVTVDAHKIDDAAVDAELEKLRNRHATYQTESLLGYEPGWGVTVDITVHDDKGREIEDLTRTDQFLAHPENSLPEQVVGSLRGQQAGDTFQSRVPEVRYSEGGVVTSQEDVYTVKVREVKRRVLPELDEEFARDVGNFESVEQLREEMRKQMERNEEQRLREQTLEKIYDQLIERNPFALPATLVRQMQEEMLREHQERLRLLGVRMEDLGEDPADYVLRTQRNAERLMRVILLNRAIAEKEDIEATDEDVDKAIERQAETEGRRPLAIRARLEAHRELDRFRSNLKHDLVEEFLREKATVHTQYVAPDGRILTPGER